MTDISISVSLTLLRAEGTTGSVSSSVNAAAATAIYAGADVASVLLTIAGIDGWGANGNAIAAIYRGALGREPDSVGYRFWTAYGHGLDASHGSVPAVITEASLLEIAGLFIASPEGASRGANMTDVRNAMAHQRDIGDMGTRYALADALAVGFDHLDGPLTSVVGSMVQHSHLWG